GSSSSVPFSGSAGRKNIGQIELAAMEPMPEKEAVSPACSFTDTRYYDQSTRTNQSRTMAIIRTSEKSGYYVDIYRSDNPISNDYIYHNIGDTLLFLNSQRQTVKTVETNYPVTGKDYPGFRFFTSVKKIENYEDNLIAMFIGKNEKQEDIFMQVHLAGFPDRTYYQARSLRTRTSGRLYSSKSLPLFTMRDEGESHTKPFIAVFEPFTKKDGYSVDSIKAVKGQLPGEFTSLWVFNKNGSSQLILQSVNPELIVENETFNFKGYFGVVGVNGKELEYLYLGKGTKMSYAGYSLHSKTMEGSANLMVCNKNEYIISCNQPVEIVFPFYDIKQAKFHDGKTTKNLKVVLHEKGVLVSIPTVKNARLELSTVLDSGKAINWRKLNTVSDIYRIYPEKLKTLIESLNLDYPGLEKVKKAYSINKIQKACEYLLDYYKTSSSALFLRRELPPPSDRKEPQADSIVKNVFTFYNQPFVVPKDVNGHIFWECWGPSNDIEWAWALNRHYHINTLLDAYFKTGNRIYAKTIEEHIKDWIISSLPYPATRSSTEMWRGLEVSFRIKAWSRVFYGLMMSNLLTPATRILILSSLLDHAHYARNFHSQGNWLTMELSGLATLATAWPEFKSSREWMEYSLKTLSGSLEEQVYPDGAQTELTSSYHYVALNNFILFMDICKKANVYLPENYKEKIEKMWNYLAWTMKPDGFGLLNNDADLIYFRDMIIDAANEFQRNDWLYIATNGGKGSKPESYPSVMFPWAGHMIMRSSFDRDAHFAFFDIGPWGTGHQHNDKLHLSVSAFGKDFLVDAGRFAYRGQIAEKFRQYAIGSLAHNVVIPDGKLQSPG
ncbi:MAG: heparinase II/III family protein, partial [Bacteroidales bacterium]